MKKLVLLSLFALILFSCGNQKSKNQTVVQAEPEIVILTVDDLYKNAVDLADKEVVVKGTVMHICKSGGERCFIMGSTEDVVIRIEAGEKIGSFNQELMGSNLEIVGVLREVKTKAEAHNPGEHHDGETNENNHNEGGDKDGDHHAKDVDTDEAHKVIAESQETAKVVYFIEGLSSKEL
jgi:hypothetical protein